MTNRDFDQPALDVVDLDDAECATVAKVGGKGASLAALRVIPGVSVPGGFCVSTDAFRRSLAAVPAIAETIGGLASLDGLSTEVRRAIGQVPLPDHLVQSIAAAVRRHGGEAAYAVRSSATAEDLPTASFAGQHESFLNVVGPSAVIDHVRRCWASLFTDRAVAYRDQHRIDHRTVAMAVVVQRMAVPRASGVLFTAHPTTGNRKVAAVEATFGLGDALVSGAVDADLYKVRDGHIVECTVRQAQATLTTAQVLELVGIGRRIEAHFGSPQDIEWCLDDHGFQIVQSRPITTLFPIPEPHAGEEGNRVYVSVGHQQMMTEPMTPLGLSVWQLTSRAPMRIAGGRLFVDVTAPLSSPATRAAVLDGLGRSDPLIRDALETVLERSELIAIDTDGPEPPAPFGTVPGEPIDDDGSLVAEIIERTQESVARLRRDIENVSGPALFEFILADLDVLRSQLADPQTRRALAAGFDAALWLDENLRDWLGADNAVDELSLAAPGNVTSEMGLALLDVADVVRAHPEVVAFLRSGPGDQFLDQLADADGERLEGASAARDAIVTYLDAYGMRCVGEIDIARPRWSEQPSALVPLILANVDNFEPEESRRRVERGREQARRVEHALLQRLRGLPDGEEKAARTEQMIRQLRTFVGYREYPKYAMVSRYHLYKQALLAEAERLIDDGALDRTDDIYLLTFQELHEVARTRRANRELLARRAADLRYFATLSPPRVLTSDGEALNGSYRRDDVPLGALPGLAVSAGTVEGRARVVLDMADADVAPGDILVTPHTDPSWSPLFLTVAGLVTEVGGLMTHGAVIAREYGLAAVVGVEHATRRIADGQRIRVNGTSGYIELL